MIEKVMHTGCLLGWIQHVYLLNLELLYFSQDFTLLSCFCFISPGCDCSFFFCILKKPSRLLNCITLTCSIIFFIINKFFFVPFISIDKLTWTKWVCVQTRSNLTWLKNMLHSQAHERQNNISTFNKLSKFLGWLEPGLFLTLQQYIRTFKGSDRSVVRGILSPCISFSNWV